MKPLALHFADCPLIYKHELKIWSQICCMNLGVGRLVCPSPCVTAPKSSQVEFECCWVSCFSFVSGSPYYDNVRPLSYPDSDAVLICFDISRPETLDSVLKKVCCSSLNPSALICTVYVCRGFLFCSWGQILWCCNYYDWKVIGLRRKKEAVLHWVALKHLPR